MTDRPITFSAPMIHALLDGRKTQTRRLLKPPYGTLEYLPDETWRPICTKFFKGDRLWVKEAWRTEAAFDDREPSKLPIGEMVARQYEADGKRRFWKYPHLPVGRYRHARFMPRRFSRLTLIVTDVRVQRVQDIRSMDALAEGIEPDRSMLGAISSSQSPFSQREGYHRAHVEPFRDLWNSIHGPDAWDRNDWVAALTFSVHRKNIGEMAND